MRFLTVLMLVLSASAAPAARADEPLPPELAPYAGKVVYVDFWASWCGPCAQSFPWLNEMQTKYGKDLVIVGVNVDTDAKAADKFLVKHPAQFAIVRDPKGTLPERFRIEGMPTSVILGPTGKTLHQHSGFHPEQTARYEAAIKAALANQEARQ